MELYVCDTDSHPTLDRGDIVSIRPDGFMWGVREESATNFRIVSIPDEDAADLDTDEVQDPEDPSGLPLAKVRHRIFAGNIVRKRASVLPPQAGKRRAVATSILRQAREGIVPKRRVRG